MKPISYEDAKALANEWIAHAWNNVDTKYGDMGMVLMPEDTKEYEFGWVFFYAPKKYLETRDPDDTVPGTAPLIVNFEGNVVPISSSVPPDVAISTYREEWLKAHQKQ